MRVAIMSDIHDDVTKLRAALERLGKLGDVGELICLGDLCSPFVVAELGRGFSGPVHVVFGNNDGDRWRIAEGAKKYPHVKIHGEYAELGVDGKRFSVNHFDNIGKAIAAGQEFDVVCCGRSHRFGVEKDGEERRGESRGDLRYPRGQVHSCHLRHTHGRSRARRHRLMMAP